MEQYCQFCKKIVKGRADKKFCDDQCRSSYHYQSNWADRNVMNRINQILKKNRKILQEIHQCGKTNCKKQELLSAGLNFNFYTHSTDKKHHFCYEYGYQYIDHSRIEIIKLTNTSQQEQNMDF